MKIDLNCDCGESYGPWTRGDDDELLRVVTSANIACGFHAGDPLTIARTVARCRELGVAIGAHPGWQDLAGFGRRVMDCSPEETYALVLFQVGALHAFARAAGGRLVHVKPHGALYNQAAQQRQLADAVARAVFDADPELILVGLANSELVTAAQRLGLHAAREVFLDRRYRADGSLTPRSQAGAVLTDESEAVAQAVGAVCDGTLVADDGTRFAVAADTLCLHADTPGAAHLATAVRRALEARGVTICALTRLSGQTS